MTQGVKNKILVGNSLLKAPDSSISGQSYLQTSNSNYLTEGTRAGPIADSSV